LIKLSCLNCKIEGFDKRINFPKNLKKLSIENCFLINDDFNSIFQSLVLSDEIRNNLEYISFAQNNITKVDLNQFIYQQKHTFYEIREFNFRKNNIFKFSFVPEFFPELRVINCCFNNFSRPIFSQLNDKILVLLNNNIYLSDNNLRNDYFNKLNNQISKFDYPSKFLSFNSLFSKSYNKLNEISISGNIMIAIKILDLSYCSLTNDMVFEFFNKNTGCFNLSNLYLKGNEINDNFFDLFISKNMHDTFRKLQSINLYDNYIEGTNLDKIYDFIVKNKNLSFINICNNPISDNYQMETNNFNINEEIKNPVETKNDLDLFIKKLNIDLPKIDKVTNSNRDNFRMKFDCGNFQNLISSMEELESSRIYYIK
jgi:hypothetical protein